MCYGVPGRRTITMLGANWWKSTVYKHVDFAVRYRGWVVVREWLRRLRWCVNSTCLLRGWFIVIVVIIVVTSGTRATFYRTSFRFGVRTIFSCIPLSVYSRISKTHPESGQRPLRLADVIVSDILRIPIL